MSLHKSGKPDIRGIGIVTGTFAALPVPRRNVGGLREVVTIYDARALNAELSAGSLCIVKRKERNSELDLSALLLRNRLTGEYVEVPSRVSFQRRDGTVSYSEEEWELVQTVEGYARRIRHEGNWGAYILPADAKIGERFYICELIEDLVASKFWGSVFPAESAEADWDGAELVIDHSSYCFAMIG